MEAENAEPGGLNKIDKSVQWECDWRVQETVVKDLSKLVETKWEMPRIWEDIRIAYKAILDEYQQFKEIKIIISWKTATQVLNNGVIAWKKLQT